MAARERWSIEFIKKDAHAVNILIDQQMWLRHPLGDDPTTGHTWKADEAGNRFDIPEKYQKNNKMDILAVAAPKDNDAKIRVWYGNKQIAELDFDNKEEDDLDNGE